MSLDRLGCALAFRRGRSCGDEGVSGGPEPAPRTGSICSPR
jgi:hypothetical protein